MRALKSSGVPNEVPSVIFVFSNVEFNKKSSTITSANSLMTLRKNCRRTRRRNFLRNIEKKNNLGDYFNEICEKLPEGTPARIIGESFKKIRFFFRTKTVQHRNFGENTAGPPGETPDGIPGRIPWKILWGR